MVIRKKTRFFKKIRPILLEKHNHRCAQCGSTEDLQIDHIKALVAGGTDNIDNLQILCGKCNRRKAGGKSHTRQMVDEMLDQRKIAMREQWATENAEMFKNIPGYG